MQETTVSERIFLPCCPDFNGLIPCNGCGLTASDLEEKVNVQATQQEYQRVVKRIMEMRESSPYPSFKSDCVTILEGIKS